ncbi:hypothetical protein [Silvimonas soli]|uniref:hypothetical protein n=1 Tax=Silvimonas soli TaxID=2980100 RepID=UPI0024B34DC1|nr:hypothetical protein [Silvimonas soli]
MTIQRSNTEQRHDRSQLMLNLLAAMALSLAILQAWTLLETVADTTRSVPATEAATGPATVMRAAQAQTPCQAHKTRDDNSLLQGYSGYLLLEHAIADGDVLSQPLACAPGKTMSARSPASPVNFNDQQEMIQPEGVKLI